MRRSWLALGLAVAALGAGVPAATAATLSENGSGTYSFTASNTIGYTGTVSGTPIADGTIEAVETVTPGETQATSARCPVESTRFAATVGVTLTEAGTGDKLFKSETGVACPFAGGLIFDGTYTITGGTGRFTGATGSGTSSFDIPDFGGTFPSGPFTSTESGTVVLAAVPASCTGPRTGTAGRDVPALTEANDAYDGLGGDDVLSGRDGNDCLIGNTGNDTVSGGAGNDIVRGDAGNDNLAGGDGNDDLTGGSGTDTVGGGAGDDVIDVFDGVRDNVNCGDGNDVVFADALDVVSSNCENVSRAARPPA